MIIFRRKYVTLVPDGSSQGRAREAVGNLLKIDDF